MRTHTHFSVTERRRSSLTCCLPHLGWDSYLDLVVRSFEGRTPPRLIVKWH